MDPMGGEPLQSGQAPSLARHKWRKSMGPKWLKVNGFAWGYFNPTSGVTRAPTSNWRRGPSCSRWFQIFFRSLKHGGRSVNPV